MINIGGNTQIVDVRLGGTRIDKIYKSSDDGTSTLVYWRPGLAKPYLDFEFYGGVVSFDPYNVTWRGQGTSGKGAGAWTYIGQGDKGDIWRFTCLPYSTNNIGYHDLGWPRLFTYGVSGGVGSDLTYNNLGCYCDIISSGNLSINEMRNFGEAFREASVIQNICLLPFANATNVSGMFNGCVDMASGQLDEYTYLSSLADVPVHSDTFAFCGTASSSGTAELNQIPVGWGGNLAPAALNMYLSRDSKRTSWLVSIDLIHGNPFFTVGFAIDIYTTGSVSQYAGVNMRKTNVRWNTDRGASPSTSSTWYYYPCFFQGSLKSSPSGAPQFDWFALSEQPNGSLSGSSGDMPGTLDYNLFGSISAITWSDWASATPYSEDDIYFGFFVTDLSPTDIWTDNIDPLNGAYGLLYNSYFNTSVTMKFITN